MRKAPWSVLLGMVFVASIVGAANMPMTTPEWTAGELKDESR